MRIQHNIMAMNAYRNYTNNVSAMKKNLERLSSGYKINRAGDDAAGLAISEKMRAQITGLETAQKNAKDGISLVQTAEGALTEVHDMLNRMVTLATQSANGTYDNETDRAQLQKELDQLRTEIDRIADSSNFNGIKLLDGNLSKDYLATTEGIQTQQVDYANGIDCAVGEGGGSFGTYSFSIDSLFGVGDKIEIGVDTGSASTITVQFGATANASTVGFTGDTIDEQVKNICDGLTANGTISSNFEVTSDGNTITLTNRKEGDLTTDNAAKITSIKATDKMTRKDSANWKTSQVGVSGSGTKITYLKLFDNAGSTSVGSLTPSVDDTLTFEFTVGGNKWEAKLKVTEDMVTNDAATNAKNIAKALETLKFEDSADTTGSNEGRLAVGDLFTITANGTNGGDLEFEANSGIAYTTTVGKVYIDNPNGSHAAGTASGTAGTVAGASLGSAKQDKYEIQLDTSNGATNFTTGDKLNVVGTLSDGRSFEVTLEAGKDFAIDSAYNTTISNIKDALEQGKDKDGNDLFVTVKGGGKETPVNAADIFGTKGDFSLTATGGKLSIESKISGAPGEAGVASITSIGLEAVEAASVTANLNPGKVKSTADSTITFSDGVQYGSTITVGDNTYELVRSKDELSSQRNTAVVISDLSDTSAIATAMQKAIDEKDGASGNNLYTVTANKNVVTISSKDVGSTVPAPTVAAAKDISTELSFTLDPDKVISGSYVKINGQDYQFVEDRSKADAGKTAVVVNFKGADAKYLGDALANVASGKNNASVTVDDTGKVTVKSINEVDGELPVPTASFHDGKGGLTLQIGDTADDYNQLNVSISDMHCVTMGIANMSIADQDSAKAAIDTIRSAINYVSDVRGTLGATQNRLDHTINNLSVMQENIQDAESTIRDTDVAAEMMEYTKNNILIQSAQAMLAQANQVPQGVLQLLQ